MPYEDHNSRVGLFVRLLGLTGTAVRDLLDIVMVETMGAGREVIEPLGIHLGFDMSAAWPTDDTLPDLIRKRAGSSGGNSHESVSRELNIELWILKDILNESDRVYFKSCKPFDDFDKIEPPLAIF